jgi:hypothetical protein
MNSKLTKIVVQGTEINIENDFICLTDMVKAKGADARAADVIKNWIRGRGTIEFLGTWETIYNPNFKVVEFDHFRKEAGLPTFTMSVSTWVEATKAIGIYSKLGKTGGTYAHKDIAFEFGAAISPIFKLYIVKEYQRLKEIESNQYGLEWNVKRILSKANHYIHTEAVKNYIVPKAGYTQAKEWLLYADEVDLLNIALFGITAKRWRETYPDRALNGENLRDMASINELAILSNLESLNSILIKNGLPKKERFKILRETVVDQRKTLDSLDTIKTLKKETHSTFVDYQSNQKKNEPTFDQKLTILLNTPPPRKDKQ